MAICFSRSMLPYSIAFGRTSNTPPSTQDRIRDRDQSV
jgi:hypothetical protein